MGATHFFPLAQLAEAAVQGLTRHFRSTLVLDEPTANVDGYTDKLLQAALSKSFTESTIITVAHRLDTVIDYDKILVLGSGKVLEYGSPRELLERHGDHFSSMVHDTGPQMSKELRMKAFSTGST